MAKFLLIALNFLSLLNVSAISIRPADFDRLVMPCYLGSSFGLGGGGASSSMATGYSQQQSSLRQQPLQQQQQGQQLAQLQGQQLAGAAPSSYNQQSPGYQPVASYFGAGDLSASRSTGNYARDGFSSLGQQVPRANTMDNFVALVSKIEASSARLAQNPDLLIRSLLGRFRMDNYYYDVKSRMAISEPDHRNLDILPALLNSSTYQPSSSQYSAYTSGYSAYQTFGSSADDFPEQLLEPDEKCSMYFMLSHFIVKDTPSSPPLNSLPLPQLAGSLGGQRSPNLQAAGAGYPGQSANQAFSGAAGGRFPGPSPSFGSQATSNMNSFGSGISNQPDYNGNAKYGSDVLQPNERLQNLNLRNPQPGFAANQPAAFSGSSKFNQAPYVDGGGASQQNARQAIEYGVVTLQNQENAAIVLNRVLMGILAASSYPREIRELASLIYPNREINSQTNKLADDIDPLYAVTLADLWAISAIPKAGKPMFDMKMLGLGGHWNDTICPTTFLLDRYSSANKFTTAELLGGLDGLNLGILRKSLLSEGKNLKLSDLLRMYYSKAGFRPQYAEYGVCTRATVINMKLDELKRQAENYLRLYQLNLPTSDNELAMSLMRVDSFKEFTKMAAQQYVPQEVCQLTNGNNNYNDIYPMDLSSEQCELGKADVVSILDTSQQANQMFMNLVLIKLAQKIGLSRIGNTFTILTNQQDTTGGLSFNFNPILRNSTNTAEVGCSLSFDTSRSYQGGQVTEPIKLMEMFERALVNLDTEYLVRQNMNSNYQQGSSYSSSYSKPSSYVSSLFGQDASAANYMMMSSAKPKNTGGAKVIIWFNYNTQTRQNGLASGPTNWYQQAPSSTLNNNNNYNNDQYRFAEAKRLLHENFRGAAILAVSNNRDEVKQFVYDEQRDIFTDIPAGSSSASSSSDYYSPSSSSFGSIDSAGGGYNSIANLNGPADILVDKLLQRMCDVPALFQYPMCSKTTSENVASLGYISPKRKQYWMMSPKTFHSSRTVRMAFKVDGGRLRVCFGRMPRPDESAARNPLQLQQQQSYAGPISFGSSSGQQNQANSQYSSVVTPAAAAGGPTLVNNLPSGNNYYTGLEYGICKDVSPGQEIDFIVDDPCYKKAIVDCEPFYFVIKEITNPGEGDPNYMCKDPGCKRFDQVRFSMTHTGVQCNSAFKSIKANWLLIVISMLITSVYTYSDQYKQQEPEVEGRRRKLKSSNIKSFGGILETGSVKASTTLATVLISTFLFFIKQAQAQLSAPADFGQNRYGERRGSFTPSEVLAIILLVMTILLGLAITIGLCYFVSRRKNQTIMTRVPQEDFNA